MSDLEDRMRQNNIRLVKFPEGAEKNALRSSLRAGSKSIWILVLSFNLFSIERENCVPGSALLKGSNPPPYDSKDFAFPGLEEYALGGQDWS